MAIKHVADESRLKLSISILSQQRFNVPSIFKEFMAVYKQKFPNNIIKWAMLNANGNIPTDFILITEFYNPSVNVNMYNILTSPRFCTTSMSGFNYIHQFKDDKFYNDFFHDLGLLSIIIHKDAFEGFLNNLPYMHDSKKEVEYILDPLNNPTGKTRAKILMGLSINKTDENYFASPEYMDITFQDIVNLKQQFDEFKNTKLKKGTKNMHDVEVQKREILDKMYKHHTPEETARDIDVVKMQIAEMKKMNELKKAKE